MFVKKRGGSTITEYATLIAVCISAILMMVFYMRRAIAGRLRDAADGIGEQYDPRNTTGRITTTTSGKTITSTRAVDQVINGENVTASESATTMQPETTVTQGSETVGPIGNDLWN